MRNRTQLVLGLALIVVGAVYLAQTQYPALLRPFGPFLQYPLNIVSAGAALMLLALLAGAHGLIIPACIVAAIGGILYYQQLTNDSSAWAYMWTLIPGAAGIGTVLEGAFASNTARVRSGLSAIFSSAVLFVIFAAIFGKLNLFGLYGPAILLMGAGLWLVIRAFWRR